MMADVIHLFKIGVFSWSLKSARVLFNVVPKLWAEYIIIHYETISIKPDNPYLNNIYR